MDIMGWMIEPDDHELMGEFARNGSESAFARLVARYVNLVHSTAFRFTGNSHHAEEITQVVFIILARKAGKLSSRVVLSGWLYQVARLTSANFMKGEIRRQLRQQEAYMQSVVEKPESPDWKAVAPLLEDAMGSLGKTDRNAVVLRYFENKSAKEIGAALRMNEETARRRVNRAVEKLRKFFAARGVTLSSGSLMATISANSVKAAPAALAKVVTFAAVSKGATASASTLPLIKGALKIMAYTKTKAAVAIFAGVLLTVGTATVTIKEIQEHRSYSWEVPKWSPRVLTDTPPQVRIVPAKFPRGGMGWVDGKVMGIGQPLSNIFPHAYGINWARTFCKVPLPSGNYDFVANLSEGSALALQREIERKFDLRVRRETRETDVLLLTVRNTDAPGLKPASSLPMQLTEDSNRFLGRNSSIINLSGFLESCFQMPVIDGTGLTQNFDIDCKWNQQIRRMIV
jgi:RNA polymerase sigma factor (sigma-70 family)